MKKANIHQFPLVEHILINAFKDIPGLKWVTGHHDQDQTKLKRLIKYCISLCFLNGEVYLSENNQGAILLFKEPGRKKIWKTFWIKLKIAILVIKLSRIGEIIRREAYIKSIRPKTAHLYVWFLGTIDSRNGIDAVKDLKNHLYILSYIYDLPIFMETSVERNLTTYKRYGFNIYHAWQNTKYNCTIWFLKRMPTRNQITSI